MTNGRSFWDELKERRVVRVGLVYAAVAWGTVTVSETLTEILTLPETTPRLVFAIAVLGFPMAIGLAWAFQFTSAGLERAAPYERSGRRSMMPFLGGLAVGVLAVGGLAFAFLGTESGPARDSLDAASVAVLPFRVNAPPELSYLGGGIMELLATRLDGDVGPKSVPPTRVAAVANEVGLDPTLTAERLGVASHLSGAVVGDVSNIIITATLGGLTDTASEVTASVEGDPNDVGQLVDQLVAQLLSLGAGEAVESVGSLTSASREALKAYLLGQEAWQDGLYDDAVNHFDRAISLDTTFALAGIARADGGNMATRRGSGNGWVVAERHRDRLSARDLQYLEVRRPADQRTNREAIAAWEAFTRVQPDRIEAWYWLGEARVHTRSDPTPDWSRRARIGFQQALAIDPDFLPALEHMMFLELHDGHPDTLQGTAQRYLELRPGFDPYESLAEGDSVARLDPETVEAFEDPGLLLVMSGWPLVVPKRLVDDPAPFMNAALAALHRRMGTSPSLSPENVMIADYRASIALGRRERAQAALREWMFETGSSFATRDVIRNATWEGVFVDEVTSEVGSSLQELGALPAAEWTLDDVRQYATLEVFLFVTDSAYAGGALTDRLEAARNAGREDALTIEAFELMLSAWAALRAGDPLSDEALGRIDAIWRQGTHTDMTLSRFLVLAMSNVLEEDGRTLEALEVLDRRSFFTSNHTPYEVEIWLRQGRLAQQLGETERARVALESYLKFRSGADPYYADEVAEVRAALETLR